MFLLSNFADNNSVAVAYSCRVELCEMLPGFQVHDRFQDVVCHYVVILVVWSYFSASDYDLSSFPPAEGEEMRETFALT